MKYKGLLKKDKEILAIKKKIAIYLKQERIRHGYASVQSLVNKLERFIQALPYEDPSYLLLDNLPKDRSTYSKYESETQMDVPNQDTIVILARIYNEENGVFIDAINKLLDDYNKRKNKLKEIHQINEKNNANQQQKTLVLEATRIANEEQSNGVLQNIFTNVEIVKESIDSANDSLKKIETLANITENNLSEKLTVDDFYTLFQQKPHLISVVNEALIKSLGPKISILPKENQFKLPPGIIEERTLYGIQLILANSEWPHCCEFAYAKAILDDDSIKAANKTIHSKNTIEFLQTKQRYEYCIKEYFTKHGIDNMFWQYACHASIDGSVFKSIEGKHGLTRNMGITFVDNYLKNNSSDPNKTTSQSFFNNNYIENLSLHNIEMLCRILSEYDNALFFGVEEPQFGYSYKDSNFRDLTKERIGHYFYENTHKSSDYFDASIANFRIRIFSNLFDVLQVYTCVDITALQKSNVIEKIFNQYDNLLQGEKSSCLSLIIENNEIQVKTHRHDYEAYTYVMEAKKVLKGDKQCLATYFARLTSIGKQFLQWAKEYYY